VSASDSASQRLFERASQLFPGGVNSPVRAFRAVGGTPPFMVSGEGAQVFDADGRAYTDFLGSWGPLILGHADPGVEQAIVEATRAGTTFGAPTEREITLGELIVAALPSIERLRFVSSGTEAAMSALRLARAYTGRTRVVKFDGGYHGHSDALLVSAGSGVLTHALPSSAGVPSAWTDSTLSVPYNDLEAVEAVFQKLPDDVAAVIVEPIAGNMGVVPPMDGFLQGLRALTERFGAVLIFDEVITGFRIGLGGAQARYGITPDLTCLGKIIGGGLPAAAYGGRRDIMALIAPEGPVYQAGTLSGNPVAMAAGAATLRRLRAPGTYERLDNLGGRLADGITEAAKRTGMPVQVQRVGSMLTPFFCDSAVRDEASAKRCDTATYARFLHGLLDNGVYAPPSQFEAWFVSLAHTQAEIDAAVAAVEASMLVARDGRQGP